MEFGAGLETYIPVTQSRNCEYLLVSTVSFYFSEELITRTHMSCYKIQAGKIVLQNALHMIFNSF